MVANEQFTVEKKLFELIESKKHIALPGFTIPELLVSMIISAIVIAAGYYAFQLFSYQSKAVRKNYSSLIEHEQMIANLKTEFATAESIERDFEILKFSFENRAKEYQFLDSIIILSIEPMHKADTFFINTKSEAAFFNGRYIDVGKIDKFELTFFPFGNAQNLIFTKKYSATDLMNFEYQYEN